jgi:hypothetical protein
MKFFKKKKQASFDIDALHAEIMFRIRALFLDSGMEDPWGMSVMAGTSFTSKEVADMEELESKLRVSKIIHLFPLLIAHATTLSKGTTELQRTKNIEMQMPEEFWDKLEEIHKEVAFSAICGSLAQLVDLQLISVGPRRPK